MLEKLMEYQEVDKELKAIEDSLKASADYKKLAQATKFLRTVGDTKAQIEDRAKALYSLAAELENTYALLLEEQHEFDESDSAQELSTVSYLKKKSQELSRKFSALEAEINKLNQEIVDLTAQYKKLSANTKAMMEQREKSKEGYEALVKEKEAEKESITKRLKEIAKDIPKEYMEKYLEKRKDNKFPICYEIEINPKGSVHCTACGTEFSALQLTNLKQKGFIECENCRKLIFVKK